MPTLAPRVNGWQITGTTPGRRRPQIYLKRATLARIGLGSNPPEDAIYPLTFVDADGQPLSGENDYLLHFDGDELPPYAFWSLTLYDTNGFQVANPLDRRALGDRDPLRDQTDGLSSYSSSMIIRGLTERPTGCPPPAVARRCSCACTSRRRGSARRPLGPPRGATGGVTG